MGALFTKNCKGQSDGGNHEAILFDWIKAASDLHENYNNLSRYLQENQLTKGERGSRRKYAGQCPPGQFLLLIKRMEVELQNLIDDLDSLPPQDLSMSTVNYDKLADHTLILNKLNQQAQTRLLLAACTVA